MQISTENYGLTIEGVTKSDLSSNDFFEMLLYSVVGAENRQPEFIVIYDFDGKDGYIGSDVESYNSAVITCVDGGKLKITFAELETWYDDDFYDAINGDVEAYVNDISAERDLTGSYVESQVKDVNGIDGIVQGLPFNTCSVYLGFFG